MVNSPVRPVAHHLSLGKAFTAPASKVSVPGAPIEMSEKIVTIAALLKEQGYATGQFGKNHLGDLNRMLLTNHGFDEFFGNLYHLNAEEEPEMYDYPSKEEFPDTSTSNSI
jgi:arylsulfatase A-like enzyme